MHQYIDRLFESFAAKYQRPHVQVDQLPAKTLVAPFFKTENSIKCFKRGGDYLFKNCMQMRKTVKVGKRRLDFLMKFAELLISAMPVLYDWDATAKYLMIDTGFHSERKLTWYTSPTRNQFVEEVESTISKAMVDDASLTFVVVTIAAGEGVSLHSNAIIIDSGTSTVEHFEPHGSAGINEHNDWVSDAVVEASENEECKYIDQADYCPTTGPQNADDYCTFWTILYIYMRISHPHVPRSDIMKALIFTHTEDYKQPVEHFIAWLWLFAESIGVDKMIKFFETASDENQESVAEKLGECLKSVTNFDQLVRDVAIIHRDSRTLQ